MSQRPEPFIPTATLRPLRTMLALFGIGALVAACGTAPSSQPFDVGNMAYPEPVPQGNLSTTVVTGRRTADTGNMAYPEPVPQGNLSTTVVTDRRPTDTGNMAYPEPLPAGNGPNTRVRQ